MPRHHDVGVIPLELQRLTRLRVNLPQDGEQTIRLSTVPPSFIMRHSTIWSRSSLVSVCLFVAARLLALGLAVSGPLDPGL
jgi:hypothetical protein